MDLYYQLEAMSREQLIARKAAQAAERTAREAEMQKTMWDHGLADRTALGDAKAVAEVAAKHWVNAEFSAR
jgi:hypothetical protein